MVEITRLYSDPFLSNSDKHRGTHFPYITNDDVCLETGIDVGDGTHIVYKPGLRHSSYTYSISQRYPDEWFGGRFVLHPLLSKLYGISPKFRKSSPRRNGICVYLNSRAILLYKCRTLGLSRGERSRVASIPPFVKTRGRNSILRFLEGYQYADGSFICGKSPCVRVTTSSLTLAQELDTTADEIPVGHSISKDHPTTGFSLRISGERSIHRWLQRVPLLTPVQISKFLVWNRLSECPSRLFLSQCVGLLLGDTSPKSLSKDKLSNDYQKRFLESVDLLTLFILHSESLTVDHLARESVARSKKATQESIRRLRNKGLVRNSQSDQETSYALTSTGSEVIAQFEEAWEMIRNENPRIFPLKSYQCLSVARMNAEEPPRLANLSETLESSA